jgi:sulfite exporter TauE/SafE
MDSKRKTLTKEEQQNAVWFIVSITGTIVTIITASILIIQFSKNYKDKARIQHILFLISGVLMLSLGIYLNNIIIEYTNNNQKIYGKLILIPRLLLKINIAFAIYTIYTIIKRTWAFIMKK